jgi:hypothetical protein
MTTQWDDAIQVINGLPYDITMHEARLIAEWKMPGESETVLDAIAEALYITHKTN